MKKLSILILFVFIAAPQALAKNTVINCLVAEINEDANFLEEGLGSAYDMDDNGYFYADEDAIEASLVTINDIKKKTTSYKIGLGTWVWKSAKATITYDSSMKNKEDFNPVEYQIDDGHHKVRIRFFTKLGFAAVFAAEKNKKEKRLATLDCRGTKAPKRE